MARRIGTVGYYVMLPNLFYRDGGPSFDPALLATRGPDPEMDRLNRALSHSMVLSDTRALIDFAAADPAAREPIGTIGYCMGGRHAYAAAGTFPDRVAAMASLHAGFQVTGAADSAHLLTAPRQGLVLLRIRGRRPAHAPGASAHHRRCVPPARRGRGSRDLSRHRARIHVSHPPLLRQGVGRARLGTGLFALRPTASVNGHCGCARLVRRNLRSVLRRTRSGTPCAPSTCRWCWRCAQRSGSGSTNPDGTGRTLP